MKTIKRFAVIILLLVACPVWGVEKAPEKVTYMTYINARFQYEVKFPRHLVGPDPPPDNNDGRNFYSKDKNVHMCVVGQFNSLDYTWEDEFKKALDLLKDTKITYKSFKQKSFVISGYRGDKIYYHKELTVMQDKNETYYIFEIEYPQKDKETWNDIAAICANSLKLSKDSPQTDDFK